ncbi:LysM peptidoglycan-binding domain-containing protein [Amycolatopsis sp. NPDC058986]|uniref:LysM peptidoglycan-binding domain-containing protein n=1 Tax=unclassified Amycolatopsis TaxID=2618356 RepID=UPI003672926D
MTSRTAQRLRGGLAALALGAFLAGVPCVLLALGATPARLLPDRWPEQVPISQWPERIWNALRWAWLTGDLVADLMIAVAWAGWGLLTLSVITEFVRQMGHGVRAARGVLARVPGGRWIAGLVAAILVATSVGTASATGAPAAPVAATAPPWPQKSTTTPSTAADTAQIANRTESASVAPAARHEDAVPYTVVHGDTLWGLAERHLGAGTRYHDIVQLNPNRLAHGADELHPGWVLLLPPGAHNLPRPAPVAATGRTVIVAPGDTLTAIAARELDDAQRWHDLFVCNVGRTQPDGRALRDPDLLLPGWHLHLPTPPPADGPPPPPPGSVPAPARSSAPSPPPPRAPEPAHEHGNHTTSDTAVWLPGGGLVGLGLAVSVAILLTVARCRRRAHRTPTGHLTPSRRTPGSAGAEVPQPGPVVAALNQAAYTRHAESESDAAEPVRARSAADGEGPAPAGVGVRPRIWPPPAPLLTAHAGGDTRTLDLAATAGLALAGPGAPAAARAVLATVLAVDARYPAEALLADPATADLIVGQSGDTALHRAPGVDAAPTETAALARLHTELARRTRLRADDQLDADLHHDHGPSDDRRQERLGESTEPVPLLLVVARPSSRCRREWAPLLEQSRAVGIHALLLLGEDYRDDVGDVTQLTLDLEGVITAAHGPGTDAMAGARAETLTPAEADEIWHLLAAARTLAPRQPHDDTSPGGQATAGDRGVDTAAAHAPRNNVPATTVGEEEAAVVVRLLGGVRVDARGSHVRGLRARSREVLAYLTAHQHGTTADTLREAVLPDQPAARLHEAISYARSALRTATGADDAVFVLAESGRYRLDPKVITADVWTLEASLNRARTTTDPDARLDALRRVVRVCRAGAPLQGAPYAWAEPVAEHWRSHAVDALVALATTVRDDNPDEALDALAVALTWDPYTEALYRRTIALQRDLGRLDAAHATYRRLHTALREIDLEPDPDTTALLDKAPIPQR